MIIKLLTQHPLEFQSLKGGYTGSSESIDVKMPHCWKSHVMAHLFYACLYYYTLYTQAVKAKLKRCTGESEPTLLANAISTKIECAAVHNKILYQTIYLAVNMDISGSKH